jgi:hypothetical protein
MAKQVKIGFERVPVPIVKNLEPLYDRNTGIPLKNSDGGSLYTEALSPVPRFGDTKNSLSLHVNNDEKSPVKIVEQFAETSQVSSSLLGIPRSETLLSLFSDVSIYGVDENIWEFYRSPTPSQPNEWITRRNPTYGERFYQNLQEVDNEQALAIVGFPTPWTYPFGPRFADVGRYNAILFVRYIRFIQLGNEYYDFYSSRGFETFAEENFLSSSYASLDEENTDDIFYNEEVYPIETIFAQIEKWTLAWMNIRDNKLFDPEGNRITFVGDYDSTNTAPGYSSSARYHAELQSKRVFRYQPGRISGFTFGVRASTDEGSVENVIEWGCANETDEYMFQIKGSQFNIIRRSTIPLPAENLERMGLDPDPIRGNQQLRSSPSYYRSGQLWETVVPRSKFNGDALDGNGRSGYVISFEQVSMYKIEFGWYGAIGAKFYAYVPAGNEDARWVLIHTIVIENQIGEPCLKDPYFRFRYMLNITNTSRLTFPQYIYKYGASYFVDGGDEGSTSNYTYSSEIVNINSINSRSLLGIYPKNDILNRDGIAIQNRKYIIPTKMYISSAETVRIDVIECEGCNGHSHHYSPGLRNGKTGIEGRLTIDGTGNTATFEPYDENVTVSDYLYDDENIFTRVIGDGLYSTYLYSLDESSIGIARRAATSSENNPPSKTSTYETTEEVRLSDGSLKVVKNGVFENVRLIKWNSIVASSVPLSKKNIAVNFLNPNSRDGSTHFADFFIGITNKKPEINLVTEELEFDNAELNI